MTIFEQQDIVAVPFPFVELDVVRTRPALVVWTGVLDASSPLLWVLMITNAAHRPWLGDVPVPDLPEAGLPVASVIRTRKIATVEAREGRWIGRLADAAWRLVATELNTTLGIN